MSLIKCVFPGCETIFKPKTATQKYCSYRCQERASTAKKKAKRQEQQLLQTGDTKPRKPRKSCWDIQETKRDAVSTIWLAYIVNETDSDFSRKIKITSYRVDYAVAQAKDYCCLDEHLKCLFDDKGAVAWENTPEGIKKDKRRLERDY